MRRPTTAPSWPALILTAVLIKQGRCDDSSLSVEMNYTTLTPSNETTIELEISDLSASNAGLDEYVASNSEYSIIYINWKSNADKFRYSHRIEIKRGDSEEDDWTPIFISEACCDIKYYHTGQWRTAKFRIAVINTHDDSVVSDYIESEEVFLPAVHHSSIPLTIEEVGSQLHVQWTTTCRMKNFSKYELRYRYMNSTDWNHSEELSKDSLHTAIAKKGLAECVIQLFAYDDERKLVDHSEPVHYKFKHILPVEDENTNRLILKAAEPKSVIVDAVFDEAFKSLPMRYNLIIRPRLTPLSQNISFTSQDKKFPITVELPEYFELYVLKLEFEVMENSTEKGSTEESAIFIGESAPNKVAHAKVELSSAHSKYHATLDVRWATPRKTNGVITGYKIRWKTSDSKHTLFEVEQCKESYNLMVFSPNTTYQIFISAKTSKGYGPETQLNFTVGSPPDWIHTHDEQPAKPLPNVTHPPKQHIFVAQRRKLIGEEYGLGHGRILLFTSALMVSVMVFFVMSKLFASIREKKQGPQKKGKAPPPAKAEAKRRKKPAASKGSK